MAGKYNDGNTPEDSRYANHKSQLLDKKWATYLGEGNKEATLKKLTALGELAKELGYTQAQLSLAWAIAN